MSVTMQQPKGSSGLGSGKLISIIIRFKLKLKKRVCLSQDKQWIGFEDSHFIYLPEGMALLKICSLVGNALLPANFLLIVGDSSASQHPVIGRCDRVHKGW